MGFLGYVSFNYCGHEETNGHKKEQSYEKWCFLPEEVIPYIVSVSTYIHSFKNWSEKAKQLYF